MGQRTLEGVKHLLAPRNRGDERITLMALGAGILLLFAPTLSSFLETWSRSYQEHGFAVAALVAWLIWDGRDEVLGGAREGVQLMVPASAALSLAWLIAAITSVALVHQVLFVAILVAWALASFGAEGRGRIAGAALTFSLAIPFWSVLVPALQRMTTVMSGSIARLAGVSAVIRDDTITIATGTFLVEAGCSGINYLMAGLTLGAAYGHLFARRWWTRVQIVALAGAVAIVGNWLRVALLVVLGDRLGITSPYVAGHLWQGWVIFSVLLIPTFLLAGWIQGREADAGSQPARPRQGESALASPLVSAQASFEPGRPRRAARAAVAAVLGPVLYLGIGLLPTRATQAGVAPLGLSERWGPLALSPSNASWTPAFSGIDDTMLWTVPLPEGPVTAGRYFFADQRQGDEMIQWGNVIAPDSALLSQRYLGPVGPRRLFVREAVLQDGDAPRLAWYWYRVAGANTPFPIRAKVLEVVAFLGRAPASELIVLSARCAPNDCVAAAAALRQALDGGTGG